MRSPCHFPVYYWFYYLSFISCFFFLFNTHIYSITIIVSKVLGYYVWWHFILKIEKLFNNCFPKHSMIVKAFLCCSNRGTQSELFVTQTDYQNYVSCLQFITSILILLPNWNSRSFPSLPILTIAWYLLKLL